jgi:hypothetical protein
MFNNSTSTSPNTPCSHKCWLLARTRCFTVRGKVYEPSWGIYCRFITCNEQCNIWYTTHNMKCYRWSWIWSILHVMRTLYGNDVYCICLGRAGAEREGPQERPAKPRNKTYKSGPTSSNKLSNIVKQVVTHRQKTIIKHVRNHQASDQTSFNTCQKSSKQVVNQFQTNVKHR